MISDDYLFFMNAVAYEWNNFRSNITISSKLNLNLFIFSVWIFWSHFSRVSLTKRILDFCSTQRRQTTDFSSRTTTPGCGRSAPTFYLARCSASCQKIWTLCARCIQSSWSRQCVYGWRKQGKCWRTLTWTSRFWCLWETPGECLHHVERKVSRNGVRMIIVPNQRHHVIIYFWT